jgi:RimJ/RimL family protein N-acetyltransferase
MFGPVVEGARIRLEPPRLEHSSVYRRWREDMVVTRYLRDRYPPSARQQDEDLERAAADPGQVLWTIALREGGVIGLTALENIDWRTRDAEISIAIGDKTQWRRGYATEAMGLGTAYAFRELGFRKVWAGVEIPNAASRRALEKIGYRQCGLHRQHFLVDGERLDVWLGEVGVEDWAPAREAACSAPG